LFAGHLVLAFILTFIVMARHTNWMLVGTISIGSGLGSGLGSWAGGLIHDWTQGYNWLIAFALVNVVLGLIPFLVVPALRR
jgi:predicted MFS family arabinose efflux permease